MGADKKVVNSTMCCLPMTAENHIRLCLFFELISLLVTVKIVFVPGMRASVHVDLPGWTKEGLPALKVTINQINITILENC